MPPRLAGLSIASSGAARSRVPEGTRLYAVGDIHGRADLLARLDPAERDGVRRLEG